MRAEILSPAGSWESMVAAVQSGADAVYMGVGSFNARRSAKNFTPEDFAQAVRYCHLRGVRVYLTLNTLLSDRELPQAADLLRHVSQCGADAVLVQDWGALLLAQQVAPDLPIHASTQMSIFSLGGANKAAALGMERVVLARELSKDDIRTICQGCAAEIETFAHGALCMCYSGQCAMSALIGGRSGNRGRCAQPCRMVYGVNEDAKKGHPLSLKDANLSAHIREMEEMGVACLKLEGRMKRPEYVSVITSIYRRLVDENRQPTRQEAQDLYDAFSRSGFTDWYYQGKKGAGMFGTRPEKAPEPKELFAAARAVYEKENARTVPITMHCVMRRGEASSLTVTAPRIRKDDVTLTVEGAVPEDARNRALTAEDLQGRLGKTGGTVFAPTEISVELDDGLMLPASAINALRRDALEALKEALETQLGAERRSVATADLPEGTTKCDEFGFTVSVKKAEQVTKALLECGPEVLYIPVEILDQVDLDLCSKYTKICAILPRVFHTKDEAPLREMLKKHPQVTAVQLHNLGHFPIVEGLGLELRGGFGLNVFNSRALLFLKEQGCASAAVSFELRQVQIRDMVKYLPCEAFVYGRLPLMLTENCIDENSRLYRPVGNFLSDRTGAHFPLLPAYGHRNEIENSCALFLADKPDYRVCGLRWGCLRFTTESPEECVEVFHRYLDENEYQPEDFTRGLFYRGVE